MKFFNCDQIALSPYHPDNPVSSRRVKVYDLSNWSHVEDFELNKSDDHESLKLIERLYNTFSYSKKEIPFFTNSFFE